MASIRINRVMFADRAARKRMVSRFMGTIGIVLFFALARTVWFVTALCVWLPKTSAAYTLFFQVLAPLEALILIGILAGVSDETGSRIAESGGIAGLAQVGRTSSISPALAWFIRLRIIDTALMLINIVADTVQYAQRDSAAFLVGFIVADALIWLEAVLSILFVVMIGVVDNREQETPAAAMRLRAAVPAGHPTMGSLRHLQKINVNANMRAEEMAAQNVPAQSKRGRWSRPVYAVNR